MLAPVADASKHRIALAREHLDRREVDQAEQILEAIVAGGERYADVHHLLALVARERGDFARAVERLERAVAINPRYTDALLALAITYNDLGRYGESRAIRERLASALPKGGPRLDELDPYVLGKIANQHAALAAAYRDAGCLDDAARELGRAVELRPGFVDLRVKLATLLREAGRVDEAIAHLEDACARAPGYVEAHVQLGFTALGAGRRDLARRALDSALALDPENERARAYARMFSGPPTAPDAAKEGGAS
jgi:tetratricopeptide (TPR) repeat protein